MHQLSRLNVLNKNASDFCTSLLSMWPAETVVNILLISAYMPSSIGVNNEGMCSVPPEFPVRDAYVICPQIMAT